MYLPAAGRDTETENRFTRVLPVQLWNIVLRVSVCITGDDVAPRRAEIFPSCRAVTGGAR